MRRGLLSLGLALQLCLVPVAAIQPRRDARLTAPALRRPAQTGDQKLGLPGAGRRRRDSPAPIPRQPGELGRAAQLKIGLNVLLWWALNVVFNICNKHLLNTWQHPWALAVSYWLIGTLCMLPLYMRLPVGARLRDGKRAWVAQRSCPMPSRSDICTVAPVVALLCGKPRC